MKDLTQSRDLTSYAAPTEATKPDRSDIEQFLSGQRTARALTAQQLARLAPIGLLLFALLVRVVFVWQTGFDGLYGQDSFAYLDYAAAMKAALAQGPAPPPFFWPIGYPALVVILSAFAPLATAAQFVNVAAGALAAVLTFLITRELLRGQPGALIGSLFAGALVAVAGQMLISSVVAMSDATALLAVTLSAFGMIRFHRTRTLAWLALAGFALGWAVTTRWVYALLIPVWGAAFVAGKWDADERGRSRIYFFFPRSSAFIRVLILLAFFLLALSPQIALIAHHASRGVVSHIGNAEIIEWNLAHAWQSELVNSDGRFSYARPVGVFYTLPLVHPDYVPLWFTPLLALGLWALRRLRFFLIMIGGWIGAVWIFLIGITWENWRFPLAFFPPLAILGGIGLNAIVKHAPPLQAKVIAGWLGLGLLVALAWGLGDAGKFVERHLSERATANWVSAQLPAGATVITFGLTATLSHYSSLRVVEISEESPDSVQTVARNGGEVFVLLNTENIESQWPGRAPQINFHALRDRFGLRVVGTRAPYTLYSVGSAP
ncbi:MAG: phospholipid carrier-dependent glycosyltransferase [Chloroflexi bacterium]|nr:phospholipid carrier-dependent glycosyltransferase [Chloroflexota bacterium]